MQQTTFSDRGNALRKQAKQLVLDFMQGTSECRHDADGLRLSTIFRAGGFDWGDQKNATSSNQQYWVVAVVRELEAEGFVERVSTSGPWRLAR